MSLRDDLNYGLSAFGIQIPERLKIDEWTSKLGLRPSRNALAVVAASALLFYRFEKGHNPKVNELADAVLYCSTCLSVGYADIHPVTRAGKLLGSLLMTYGPALATRTLDGAADDATAAGLTQEHILATLRQILGKLEEQSRQP